MKSIEVFQISVSQIAESQMLPALQELSMEGGVKYLILAAVSIAMAVLMFLVFVRSA